MPKYKIKTLALLAALPFVLTACSLQDVPVVGEFLGNLPFIGGGGGGSSDITMWGLWEKDFTYQPVVSDFQLKNSNFTLDYRDMSVLKLSGLGEYKERVYTRLQQPDWDADVVMVHNSWVPALANAGLLDKAPSSLFSQEEYSETYFPVAVETGTYGGNVYAVPAYYDGLMLVYNKDHFDEAGISEPPTGWEELRRTAISLTQLNSKGEVVRAGAAIGSADNINHFSDILGVMLEQAWVQTKTTDNPEGVTFPNGIDSKYAQDALEFYIDLMTKNKIWRRDFPEASTAFANGQVSMIFVPSWQVLDIVAANPTLNIGTAPIPQALPNNPVSWGSFWMFVVPKNADDKKSAWEFISYVSLETSQQKINNEASKVRAFAAPYARSDMAASLANDPYVGALVETAPYATVNTLAGRSGNDTEVQALRNAINAVIDKEMTIENALKKAKADITGQGQDQDS